MKCIDIPIFKKDIFYLTILSNQESCPAYMFSVELHLFIQLPLTRVAHHSVLCFSWLLPPNTLMKMMLSDRNFYISSQLMSHPCLLTECSWHVPVSQIHPLSTCFLLHKCPPALPSDTQACYHKCHSQPTSVSFPFFNCKLRDAFKCHFNHLSFLKAL